MNRSTPPCLLLAASLLLAAPALPAKPAAASKTETRALIRQVEVSFAAESTHEARARVLAEGRSSFEARFPGDPARWFFRVLDAELVLDEATPRAERRAKARGILQEVGAAAEAPSDIKSRASGLAVSLASGAAEDGTGTYDQFRDAVLAHVKQFPENDSNEEYARLLARAAARRVEDQAALERVKELSRSRLRVVALAAQDKVDQLKRIIGLKKKPLALKYTAADGRKIELIKLRGKVVLIDFWASWCPECMAAAPEIAELYRKLHPKGFEILGINLDDEKERMVQTAADKGMTWSQYFDGKAWDNEISRGFGIVELPTLWLVDKDGFLSNTDPKDALEANIEKLLSKP
mgnify:FL=1